MKKLMILVFVLSTLISCGPSESEIQERIDSAVQKTLEAETVNYEGIFYQFISGATTTAEIASDKQTESEVIYFLFEPLSNRFGSTELSEILISGPNELKMSRENRIKEEQYYLNWLNEWVSKNSVFLSKYSFGSKALGFRNTAVKFKNESFSTLNITGELTSDIQFQRIVMLNKEIEGYEKRLNKLVDIYQCSERASGIAYTSCINTNNLLMARNIWSPTEYLELTVK